MQILRESINAIRKIKYIIFAVIFLTLISLALGFYFSNSQIGWIVDLKKMIVDQLENFGALETISNYLENGKVLQAIFYTFGFNFVSGAFFATVLTGIIAPLPVIIMIERGVMIGLLYGDISGSTWYYVVFFGTLILEFGAYVLSTAAGINIGLSFWSPKRFGTKNRVEAFGRSWIEAGKVIILVAIILFIAAIWEIGGLYLLIK